LRKIKRDEKMKIYTIVIAVVVFTAATAFGTPSSNDGKATGEPTLLNASATAEIHVVSSDVGSQPAIGLTGPTINGSELNLESQLTPSWLSQSPKQWWHLWQWAQDWQNWIKEASPSQVPEPASILLFGVGLAGVAGLTRKKLKK